MRVRRVSWDGLKGRYAHNALTGASTPGLATRVGRGRRAWPPSPSSTSAMRTVAPSPTCSTARRAGCSAICRSPGCGAARVADTPGVRRVLALHRRRRRPGHRAAARRRDVDHPRAGAEGLRGGRHRGRRREPPAICAVTEIAGGVANCTPQDGVPAGARPRGGRRRELRSRGVVRGPRPYLRPAGARHALAVGGGVERHAIGFNLVAGFNGPVENGVWLDGRLVKVGAAEFQFDPKATMKPWHVRTVDGIVDLEFQPEGERREDQNLVVAASSYVQPIGTFRGTIKPPDGPAVAVSDLLGVTEDHVAKW
ncbi:MAG: DUF2804 domain-containing protein [Candidatus Moduliflexus flocculans]|nr:DUF2804 domain-containing protein [Candidatus Moduliflexus flocculans]